MKIAFVTREDARSVLSWSGLNYYISKCLEAENNELGYIGSLKEYASPVDFIKKIFYSKLLDQQFPIERTFSNAKSLSSQVTKKIAGNKYDCIFSLSTLPIAYLNSGVPKIFYTDATFASMLGYYSSFNNFSSDIIRQGHALEKRALQNSALAVYASDWAAQSAINFYGISPSKVKVVPFGANLDSEYTKEDVMGFINTKKSTTLKILFNGVDWKRKGGDLVLAVIKELIRRGLTVELHCAGIKNLPFSTLPDYIINHGFLNKSVEKDKAELEGLFKSCHFLFVPSEAEAFGVVFCEASSYGMPSISRKTGGITTAITDGKNGFTLGQNAGVNTYADLISEYFTDVDKYVTLAVSSYEEYKTRLNWKAAGASLVELINEIK